jgi:hypothetical protein
MKMKMKIYQEKEEVNELYFRLQEDNNGITLTTVNEKGQSMYTVLSVTADGYLQLHKCIHEDNGLKIDSEGRILVRCF